MGRYVFKLPDVGEGTAEAELVGWHVKVGDTVAEDQILADIMTDKATVELTSPVAGVVTALHGEPGVMSPVGGPLVEFEVEGAGNASAAGRTLLAGRRCRNPKPRRRSAKRPSAAEAVEAAPRLSRRQLRLQTARRGRRHGRGRAGRLARQGRRHGPGGPDPRRDHDRQGDGRTDLAGLRRRRGPARRSRQGARRSAAPLVSFDVEGAGNVARAAPARPPPPLRGTRRPTAEESPRPEVSPHRRGVRREAAPRRRSPRLRRPHGPGRRRPPAGLAGRAQARPRTGSRAAVRARLRPGRPHRARRPRRLRRSGGARGSSDHGASPASTYAKAEGTTEVRIIGLRRKIAEKMAESVRRIPHITYVEEIDVTALEELRAHLNAQAKTTGPAQAERPALHRPRHRRGPARPAADQRHL